MSLVTLVLSGSPVTLVRLVMLVTLVVSDAIHVSDFSLAKCNVFSNISDVMNVMASVSLVMLVKLAMLSAQVKVRIGTVICPYFLRWNGVRIM